MTVTAQSKLRATKRLTQDLLLKISAAKHEFVLEMTTTLGCSLDDFDFKAFDDHVSDAISDFDYEAVDKLKDEALQEESALVLAEERSDRADYHARVA